jgi:acetyl-CoA synthetase
MTAHHQDNERYAPSRAARESALISEAEYDALYDRALTDPDGFWGDMAQRIDWFIPPKTIKNAHFDGDVSIKWFEDGSLNACYNCVDRHLPAKVNDVALIWEGDEPDLDKTVTYGELKDEVSRLANALKSLGVSKGDRVIIYMPMVLEACYAMLACARIGAVHSVVFGGFSPEALRGRIQDCGARVVITADEGLRGGRTVPLKNNVDEALKGCTVESVIVLEHTDGEISWTDGRDYYWHDLVDDQNTDCPCEMMAAEDPLFILYTSGSTGKPKGVLHTTGGYMVYAALTHEYVFDYKPGDIYWCSADVGWITGHSYVVYGPLANGATSVIFEGTPFYPDAGRFWQVIDKHEVNIFYTAPTAIRALLREGDAPVTATKRSTLRVLGTVGEPINHEAWLWYYNVVGETRCPIVDTWWQTETGGIMITPLACHTLKPGAASKPFFGVKPEIVDAQGTILEGEAEGLLCISQSWPGQARTLFGDHDRFRETYFSTFPGKYFTGDGARRDADGDLWITGRADDVINVSGHRLGTAEIENAINEHAAVSESAVVGFPHEIKGQGIYAYVTLREGAQDSPDLKNEVIALVRELIGPFAKPDVIHFTPALPKTRSGKIMRRILRKIAANDLADLGDTSTLADPDAVDQLIQTRG